MPDAGRELAALIDEFYEVWLRFHPAEALALGQPVSTRLLPAMDADDLGALVSWLETLLLALDDLDPGSLDAECRLDLTLLAGAARVEHHELLHADWPARDPRRWLPLDVIHQLTLEPDEALRPRLAGLLASLPDALRDAQGWLRERGEDLTPELVHAATAEADAARCYLRELIRGPWLRRHCHGMPELETLAEGVCDALADFRALLLGDLAPLAQAPLGCGAPALARRLAGLHHLDAPLDACRSALARALERTDSALAAPSARSDSDPEPGHADRAFGSACDAMAARLHHAGLVTLPTAPLALRRTPACPATRDQRGDYRRDPRGGVLYLADAREAEGGDRGRFGAACWELGWGGAHLLNWSNPGRATRMPRRLARDRSLRIGLGLYLEQRLALGPQGTPADRLAALRRQRHWLRLGLLDLDLNAADGVGQGRQSAGDGITDWPGDGAAEVAAAPGDAAAAALGWLALEAAERILVDPDGTDPRMDRRALVDALVGHGTVPLALAVARGLGEAVWPRVWEAALEDRALASETDAR